MEEYLRAISCDCISRSRKFHPSWYKLIPQQTGFGLTIFRLQASLNHEWKSLLLKCKREHFNADWCCVTFFNVGSWMWSTTFSSYTMISYTFIYETLFCIRVSIEVTWDTWSKYGFEWRALWMVLRLFCALQFWSSTGNEKFLNWRIH